MRYLVVAHSFLHIFIPWYRGDKKSICNKFAQPVISLPPHLLLLSLSLLLLYELSFCHTHLLSPAFRVPLLA